MATINLFPVRVLVWLLIVVAAVSVVEAEWYKWLIIRLVVWGSCR